MCIFASPILHTEIRTPFPVNHQEKRQCQAGAWQLLQTKINRIDKTVIPSTGKLFSSMDLDRAKADLEQLQNVQELANFFRDFVGLRKQIGGLIVSFAILERHPMFCRGEWSK